MCLVEKLAWASVKLAGLPFLPFARQTKAETLHLTIYCSCPWGKSQRHVASKNIPSCINMGWRCVASNKKKSARKKADFSFTSCHCFRRETRTAAEEECGLIPQSFCCRDRQVNPKDGAIDFLLFSQALGKPWWPPNQTKVYKGKRQCRDKNNERFHRGSETFKGCGTQAINI